MARTLAEEIGKKRPFDCPEQEAHLNVMRTASVLGARFGALFRKHGLTESTYNLLRILRGATVTGPGRRACHELGEQLIARVPDVTRLVDGLERRGLAERCRCEKDRRVVHVQITRKGLDVLGRLDGPTLELHRAQLGHMSKAELAELSRLLVAARAGRVPAPRS